MKLFSASLGVALACGALVLSGCEGEKVDTGGGGGGTTGAPGGGAGGPGGGAGPGGAGPGGTTDTDAGPGGGGDDGDGPGGAGPGTDDTGDVTSGDGGGDGGPGGDGGGDGGSPGGTTDPDDTALMAVAFYLRGTIDQSPSGDTMTGLRGVVGYGVDGGYVAFDDLYCDWYAETSRPGMSTDCDQCDFAFEMTYDTPGEDGGDCAYMEEGLGPYGYTGPEVLEGEESYGFMRLGSSSYAGFEYDYGYVLINYYSTWYYTYYTGFTYDNYDDPSLTDFYAVYGYFGVAFTP